MKKKKKSRLGQALIKALKEAVAAERIRPPRAGIIYTKVVPDKTKYNRKKYKKLDIED